MSAARCLLTLALVLGGGAAAEAQDSVLIIRGGIARPVSAAAASPAPRRWREVGTLPQFLTPTECRRLLHFRDGELATAARRALNDIEVGNAVVADLTELRLELERALVANDLFAAREAVYYSARQTYNAVRTAMSLAQLLARPDGTPKTLGEIVMAIARDGVEAGRDAVRDGKVGEYRREVRTAAADLDAALMRLIEESSLVRDAREIGRVQEGMRSMLRTRIPEIDLRLRELRTARSEARRRLPLINEELAAIDATLRDACR